MNPNNQIEVTIAGSFITIKNTTNPNASIETYNLLNVTSVNEYYQDYTALNAYQPGSKRYEFNQEFTVLLDIEENPTDLVKVQFDIQNVTNQAGWTIDRAGLAQAVADIKSGISTALGVGATPSGYISGSKTVAVVGTPEALAASTAITKVDVTALATNTMTLVVGDATVDATPATRTGTPLDPGDTVTIEIDDLAKVFVDVLTAGEGVSFNYYN